MQFVTFWNFWYLDASYFNCVDNSMSTNYSVWLRYNANPDNRNTGQKTINKNIRKGYSETSVYLLVPLLRISFLWQSTKHFNGAWRLVTSNNSNFKTDTLIWRGIGYPLLSHLCSLLHNKTLLVTAQEKGTWCWVSFALWSIRLSLLGKCSVANAFDDRNDDSLWVISHLDHPDLRIGLGDSVDLGCVWLMSKYIILLLTELGQQWVAILTPSITLLCNSPISLRLHAYISYVHYTHVTCETWKMVM